MYVYVTLCTNISYININTYIFVWARHVYQYIYIYIMLVIHLKSGPKCRDHLTYEDMIQLHIFTYMWSNCSDSLNNTGLTHWAQCYFTCVLMDLLLSWISVLGCLWLRPPLPGTEVKSLFHVDDLGLLSPTELKWTEPTTGTAGHSGKYPARAGPQQRTEIYQKNQNIMERKQLSENNHIPVQHGAGGEICAYRFVRIFFVFQTH